MTENAQVNHLRTHTLEATGLKKHYGPRNVVKGVNLAVKSGEVVGLLGKNGAGKTTTFYMVVGLVVADDGKIQLDGQDITHMPIYKRARMGLSYLPQEASVFRKLSVEDNIRAILELQVGDDGKPLPKNVIEARLNQLLEELQIQHLRTNQAISLSAASAAARKSPAPLPPILASFCSMNRSPASTPLPSSRFSESCASSRNATSES